MTTTPLAANLAREMARLGYNDYSLAIAAGLKADIIRDIMRGRTKQPAAVRLDAIARVLGRTSADLLGTAPLPPPSSITQPPGISESPGIPEPLGAQQPGYLVKDPAELTLLTLWRVLSSQEKRLVLADIVRSRIEDQ